MYITVKFSNGGNKYDYIVPEEMCKSVVEVRPNYVVVEDCYSDYTRYKVARVVGIYNGTSRKANKPIVDIVDSRIYMKQKMREKEHLKKVNCLCSIVEQINDLDTLDGLIELVSLMQGGDDIVD